MYTTSRSYHALGRALVALIVTHWQPLTWSQQHTIRNQQSSQAMLVLYQSHWHRIWSFSVLRKEVLCVIYLIIHKPFILHFVYDTRLQLLLCISHYIFEILKVIYNKKDCTSIFSVFVKIIYQIQWVIEIKVSHWFLHDYVQLLKRIPGPNVNILINMVYHSEL